MGLTRSSKNERSLSLVLLTHLSYFPFCSPSPFPICGAKTESQLYLRGSSHSFLPRMWDISMRYVLSDVCLDFDSFLPNYGLIRLSSISRK